MRPVACRLVPRLVGALTIALGTSLPSLAASVGDVPLAFATPANLQLPNARLVLTPAEAGRLADAWLVQVEAADPRLAVGAIKLLQDAPQELIDAIAGRLAGTDRLARALSQAGPEIRSRVRNARAVNTAKLLDFAPAAFITELDAALASGDAMSVASVSSTASGFRHLPPEVVTQVASALDRGKLGDQQRRELIGMLRSYPADLSPIQAHLQRWKADQSPDPLAAERRNLAFTALLATRAPLTEGDVLLALRSPDVGVSRAAISYLRGTGTPAAPAPRLSAAVAIEVGRHLLAAKQIGDWSGAFELLREREPTYLEEQYRKLSPSALASTWPPELMTEWVVRSPAGVRSLVARTYLPESYDGPGGQLPACSSLGFKLALLTTRAADGQDTVGDFWTTVAVKPHNCRGPLAAEIDGYLAVAGKGRDVAAALTSQSDRRGLGQLPEWQPRSLLLSEALAAAMTQRMLASDWAVAKRMLLAGVRPSSSALQQQGFWTKTKPSASGLNQEWYFRFVQAAGSVPEAVTASAAQAASDTGLNPVARATALIALASLGRVPQLQDVFLEALNDANTLVSRTSLILLGRTYDAGLPKDKAKLPEIGVFTTVLTRPGLSEDALKLLPRLVRLSEIYAHLQVEQADWPSDPSKSCFLLVPARPVDFTVSISILDAVVSDDDAHRACIGLLTDARSPVAIAALHLDASSLAEPLHVLEAVKSLWKVPDFANTGAPLKARVGQLVATASSALPYRLESQAVLSSLAETLDKDLPIIAEQIRSEHRRRLVIGAMLALPAALLLHLGVWVLLLAGYPRSPTLQAVVFWNPFVRKVIGFGYIDLVLLYVPLARRKLFAPFAPEFLREIWSEGGDAPQERGYFEGSLVAHWPARSGALEIQAKTASVTSALAIHRGRVLLLGKSGLGKSSYLRFWLARRAKEGKEILVYLRADQCRAGVEAEIVKRMKSVGSDQNLLRSVLYAGRMSVYIDGYNEVDLATQDAITSFVGDYPHGNILVTSQIPLRGFTGIETYELLPLDRGQVQAFLQSRAEVLPADAVVRDGSFRQAAASFLEDVWAKPSGEEEQRAFEEVLANPMDLTSIALLLSQGRVPDLFALERQQLETVRRRLEADGLTFRTSGFSKALLVQKLADQEDLGGLPFKPEVAELVHAKLAQVRTFGDPAGRLAAQEVRFRHDRIKDFFTHFALLDLTAEEQAAHAKDARFAGVFPYLARSMTHPSAEALREQLITLAAHVEDHRVSDSFVRELSWRQRFASHDPEWMLSHDLPAARLADRQYGDLARQRESLDASMSRLRDEIATSRRLTRILTAVDAGEVAGMARELLVALGAVDATTRDCVGFMLTAPNGRDFLLVALAQNETIRPFHVDLLLAQIERNRGPVAVVLNSQVSLPPEERGADLADVEAARMLARGAAPLSSTTLYDAYRLALAGTPSERVWDYLASCWASARTVP